MGDTWHTNCQTFPDKNDTLSPPKGLVRKLAEHIVSIVAMAFRPGIISLSEYPVPCRRPLCRKPCPGIIVADLDPEDERIVWWSPVWEDNGYISHWQGSMWDLCDADVFH